MKSIIKNIISSVFLCVILPLVALFSLLSPYGTLEFELHVIDPDALAMYRLFWILSLIVNTVFTFFNKKSSMFLTMTFAVLSVYSVFQAVRLFLI